jgi:hypothetical protein
MCLGGFLGLFLGGMVGFAICIRFLYDRIASNDGTVHSHQALVPFLGVMTGGCVGAVAGVLILRFLFAVFSLTSDRPSGAKETRKNPSQKSK